jgi:hypothetical protein
MDLGFSASMQACYEAMPGSEPSRLGQSEQGAVADQRPLADDAVPDALFFQESWILGVPAAAENWQQRRKGKAERERQSRAFREMDNLVTLFFLEERDRYAEPFPPACANCPPQPLEESSARTSDPASREWAAFAAEYGSSRTATQSMTRQSACRLLGVAATSTREQIKAAYRRMASQWHPDRLQCGTEELRRLVTEQMAAINEAYRLLCSAQSRSLTV